MTPLHVEILHKASATTLEPDAIAVVPAGDVVVTVSGAPKAPLRLDGRDRPWHDAGGMRLIALDLTRSTGFHHLHVLPGHHFFFGTEDAKAGLEGIQRMLEWLSNEATAWGGQLLFSDGTYLRDPAVVYGWLDQNADDALRAAEKIAAAPRARRATRTSMTTRGGGRPHVAQTLALLRTTSSVNLEETEGGVLAIGDRRYSPRKIVAHQSTITIDTIANRRVVSLLNGLAGLAAEVAGQAEDPLVIARCKKWREAAVSTLALSRLAPLAITSRVAPPQPSTDEQVFDEYATTYNIATSMGTFEWASQLYRQPQHAFVKYSDQIYQAFVAYAVAGSLGLTPSAALLGMAQPAFKGNGWQLWVNAVPPRHVLRSWRSYTSDPDDYRPDLLLLHDDGGVVVADAKFRSDEGRAPESGRKELFAYMAAFDAPRAVLFYPSGPSHPLLSSSLEREDRALLEVTVAPDEGLATFLDEKLPSVLERAKFTPPWRD